MRRPPAPVVVTALIVAGLIAGGTAVFLGGRAIDAADRTAITAWEQASLPHLRVARAQHRRLETEAARTDDDGTVRRLVDLRVRLEDARRALLKVHVPDALEAAASGFLTGVGYTLQALSLAERAAQDGARTMNADERARFDRAWQTALRSFDVGADALARARCGAAVPACATIDPGYR